MNNSFGRDAVIRATLLMTGTTYVTYMAGLLSSILIARAVAPEVFGQYAYFVWMVGLLGIFINNGLSVSALRFISEAIGSKGIESGQATYGWFRRAHFACACLAVPISVGIAFFNPPSGWSGSLWTFILLALVCALAKAQYMFQVSACKGFGVFRVEAVASSVTSLAAAAAVAGAFFVEAGLEVFIAIFVCSNITLWLISQLLARRTQVRLAKPAVLVESDEVRRIRRHVAWTIVLVLTGALNANSLAVYLLNRFDGAASVGFFIIAAGLTRAGMDLLSAGMSSVLMTSLSRAYGVGGIPALQSAVSDSLRYFQFLGLVIAGVGAFWAGPVVRLFYGSEYDAAISIMVCMTIIGGLTFTDGVFSAVLSTVEKQRELVWLSSASCCCVLLVSVALIPTHGIRGAVAALVIGKAITFLILVGGVTRVTTLSFPWWNLVASVMVGLVAAIPGILITLFFDSDIAMIAAGLLYSLLLLVFSIATRFWTHTEMAQAKAIGARIPVLRRLLSHA